LPSGGCADYTDVSSGHQKTQTFPAGYTNYYGYEVYSLNAQELTAQFSVSGANTSPYAVLGSQNYTVQVYARLNAAPDLTNQLYDAVFPLQFNGTSSLNATVFSPMVGSWYYTVTNTGSSKISLSIQVTVHACSHGSVGPYCNQTATDLTNQYIDNATFVVGTGGFQYFTVRSTELVVGTGLKDLSQLAPAIFASFLSWPANDSYLVAAAGNTVNLVTASIPYQTIKYLDISNVTWNIAVWTQANQQYYIWANHACANNCTYNNGTSSGSTSCNQNTGYCTCKSGYTGLWCYSSGMKVVWIILIVIACAIVLAIATGVPIACYLKSKKRKQYERV